MRIDKFTVKAQEAIQNGQSLARRAGHPVYEPEHLFKALLEQDDGLAVPILRRIGADPKLVGSRLDEALAKFPRVSSGEGASLSQRLLKLFDKAEDEARALKDEYVSSEHLLLALAQDKSTAGDVLKSSGVTRDRMLGVLKDVRGGGRV